MPCMDPMGICIYVYFIHANTSWPSRQWFDCEHRGHMNDFTSLSGFIVAVRDVLRVKEGGYVHSGHPCGGSLGMSNLLLINHVMDAYPLAFLQLEPAY